MLEQRNGADLFCLRCIGATPGEFSSMHGETDRLWKTNDANPAFGIYRSLCCDALIALRQGEPFPPCRRCAKPCRWVIVRDNPAPDPPAR